MTSDAELRDTTRNLRRTMHLAEAVDLASADVQLALVAEHDPQRALQGALHHHLGAAFDADLASLDIARAEIGVLKRVRDLQRRVSAER